MIWITNINSQDTSIIPTFPVMPLDIPGCILEASNGDICGLFGFKNIGPEITVPVGVNNSFIGIIFDSITTDLGDIGQPTTFPNGTWIGYFCAPFPEGIKFGEEYELIWNIGGNEASISANDDDLCINDEDWTWHPTLMPTMNPSNTPTNEPTLTPTYIPSKHPTDEDGEPNIPEIDTDIDYPEE